MRALLASFVVVVGVGCGSPSRDSGDDVPPDACAGLECRVARCQDRGLPPTSISGTVYAPNGTLALYGATVYIPNGDPGPITDGVACTRCMNNLPGGSVGNTTSDASGHFTLTNVPSGRNVPVIVQIGKWRRKVDLPEVIDCTDNPMPASLTSLPKNRDEGDMPKIAMVTGGCDALECLVKKLGVSVTEFTPDSGQGRVHMFASNGASKLQNNTPFATATTLWDNLDKLKQYDIAMFSCECSQQATGKSQAAMNNIKAFADLGGRVFLSHYHNIWIDGENGVPTHAPPVWPSIAACDADDFTEGSDYIDQVDNPKGAAFATWMQNVMGSTTNGVIEIESGTGRQTCTSIDKVKADQWVYRKEGTQELPQNFQFTTPNEATEDARCGRVVFSDMHVASGSSSSPSTGFPMGCSASALSPQEKALAFMFFDIASCVGPIF